jgi:hemerythrin-like domain-containing protein
MKQVNVEQAFTTIGHPLYRLNESVNRLQEEHVLLNVSLMDLYRMSNAIGRDENVINWVGSLCDLKVKVVTFMRQLDGHSQWEQTVMFPMITWYFGEILDQFALLEQEHELAEQYLKAFLKAMDQTLIQVDRMEARTMTGYLLQAYAVLTNHFKQEEEIIVALADRSNAYGY